MKFSQAIAGLEKNPNHKYEGISTGGRYYVLSNEDGYYRLDVYKEKGGMHLSSDIGAGGFNGNIMLNMQWRQVQKPVDFVTAFKAWVNGNAVRWESPDGTSISFRRGARQLKEFKVDGYMMKLGRWYIE